MSSPILRSRKRERKVCISSFHLIGLHPHETVKRLIISTDTGIHITAIDLDARDPDFASRLSQLGPVQHPSPTFSPSSTANRPSESHAVDQYIAPSSSYPSGPSSGPSSGGIFPDPARNPAIAILTARQQIADAVEVEKQAQGRKGWQGRKYADVATLRKALVLRDEQGMPESEVEQVLGLRKGSVAALGGIGTVEAV